jgi:hypothetical protein
MEVLSLPEAVNPPSLQKARPAGALLRDLLPGRMKLNRQLLLHRFNLPELPP